MSKCTRYIYVYIYIERERERERGRERYVSPDVEMYEVYICI